MTERTVLTAIGEDRPGLVEEVSEFVFARGGSIENSRFYLNEPPIMTWVDFVSIRHNNGAVMSFADGHAQLQPLRLLWSLPWHAKWNPAAVPAGLTAQ